MADENFVNPVARPRAFDDGFTLIEIMVALAVFSLAAMALIRLESATIRGAGIVDRTFRAGLVARNLAIDTVSAPTAPTLGRTDGTISDAGEAWRWTRIVSPTGDPRIVRIDVAIADRGGTALGRITMVRPPTIPVPTPTPTSAATSGARRISAS